MVIADKYRFYLEEVRKKKLAKGFNKDAINFDKVIYLTKEFHEKTPEGEVLDELNIKKVDVTPDENGYITTTLPRSGNSVKLKFLTIRDLIEIDEIIDQYPAGRIPPSQTIRLNKMIISIDGNEDRSHISKFVESMPIMDSKHIKRFMNENEPRLDLTKQVIAPSGEKTIVNIVFGVEFFRPFF